MGMVDVLVSLTSATLAAFGVGGLLYRHRIRACWPFAAYLSFAAVAFSLMVLLPGVFWTAWFRFASGVVQAALRAGVAWDIALKTLRPPLYVGRKRIRLLLLIIGLGTVFGAVFYPRALQTAFDLALLVESTSYGIAWMFAAFLLVVRHYRVPIDPLHRDIAAGFTILNVLVFYTEPLYGLDSWFGLGTTAGRDLITKTLYPLLLAFWNVSAWRRDEPTAFSPEVEKLLQPWRTRR